MNKSIVNFIKVAGRFYTKEEQQEFISAWEQYFQKNKIPEDTQFQTFIDILKIRISKGTISLSGPAEGMLW